MDEEEPQFGPYDIGEAVDARDSVNRWYESRVLDRRVAPDGDFEYYVHFRGWQPRFDTWVAGDAIGPLWGETPNWRPCLRVGSAVEFSERPGRWLHAIVTDVTRNAQNTETIFAAVRKESARGSQEPSIWVDVDCEKICQHHTHLRSSPSPPPARAPQPFPAAQSTSSVLGVSLWDIRREGLLTDVEMEIGGQTYPVHRCVLAAASGVFRAMFTAQTKDRDAPKLTLPDLSAQTFLDMIKFMYTGYIDCTFDADDRPASLAETEGEREGDAKEDDAQSGEENSGEAAPAVAAEISRGRPARPSSAEGQEPAPYATGRLVRLVLAADRFDIATLTRACEEQLSRGLHQRNVLRILALSRHLRLQTLTKFAQKFFVDNASDIVISPTFGHLLAGDATAEVAWEDGWELVRDDPSATIEEEKKS